MVEPWLKEMADSMAVRFIERIESASTMCESPIEKMMLAGILYESSYHPMMEDAKVITLNMAYEYPAQPAHPFVGLNVYPQGRVGQYRADLLLVHRDRDGKLNFLAVECDGHDFHEKTKNQAQKDKQRDRYFSSVGLRFVRFTGAEIYKDPAGCAIEVLDQMFYEVMGAGPHDI